MIVMLYTEDRYSDFLRKLPPPRQSHALLT